MSILDCGADHKISQMLFSHDTMPLHLLELTDVMEHQLGTSNPAKHFSCDPTITLLFPGRWFFLDVWCEHDGKRLLKLLAEQWPSLFLTLFYSGNFAPAYDAF